MVRSGQSTRAGVAFPTTFCGTRIRILVGGRFLPYDSRTHGQWSLLVVSFGMADTRLHWSKRCLFVTNVAVEVECKYFVTPSKIIRLVALKSVKLKMVWKL